MTDQRSLGSGASRPGRDPGRDPAGYRPPARRWRRFRDLPIWSKLGMIMIVPTLATIVVGTSGLLAQVETVSSADRTRVLANLASTSGELVHQLQDERAAAVRLLGAAEGAPAPEDLPTTYQDLHQQAEEPARRFQAQSSSLTDLPESFRDLLRDTTELLLALPPLRAQVTEGGLGLTDASAGYGELIAHLVAVRESSAPLTGETALGDRMRASAGIARAKESLSRQRVVGHEVLIRGAYDPHLRTAFIGTQTGHEQALRTFSGLATGAEQAALDQRLEQGDIRQSQLFRDYLDSLQDAELRDPPFDADTWDQVLATHADLLRAVETDLDRVVVADATDLRNSATERVLVEAGALLAVILLAIAVAWLIARSMARSLRDLRQGALAVARHGLPQAVTRLRDPALSTQLSPAEVASQIAEPLPVRGNDEFGQVTEAFNAVHLEAVRTAAEQAQLRSSVATMFVNLARRSQVLVDRLINHLDRLERGEEDPDRLAELFQLDHLATRMRRNDENLLVLAGADSTRVQRDPVSLLDVLRAAQSEVEHYTRVEFGAVDRDLEVAAHAVNDLVHLVAELLDNATAFSPPDSPVTVEARRVGDRAALTIEDRGLGLSAEQFAAINERLAAPPPVDVAVSRMMGLVVVSRLAARHGVRVELRPAPTRGTVADVTLPASVLVPRAVAGHRPVAVEPAPTSRALASGPSPARPVSEAPAGGPPTAEVPAPRPEAPAPSATLPFLPPAPPDRAEPTPAGFGGPPPASTPRGRPTGGLPAWSDLTGVTGHNGTEPGTRPTGTGTPLPRRQPGSTAPGAVPPFSTPGGTPGAAPPPPPLPTRQPAAPPPATQPPVPPPSAAPPSTSPPPDVADVTAGRRAPPPAAPAPTAPALPPEPPPWPPVRPEGTTSDPAGARPDTADTREMPIFREVESVWFQADPRRYEEGAPVAPASAAAEQAAGTGGSMERTEPAPDDTGTGAGGWRTAADQGWQAASTAAEATFPETTTSGLPKRRPLAQLVPGGVARPASAPPPRSPEAVRGLLSAYHRGVQRGREQTEATDAGPPSASSASTGSSGKESGT